MPRPAAPLPTAVELYQKLDRPPWHALSSHELADLMGVSLNWTWNQTMRGTGPEPEPEGVYIRASNRRFFSPALALEWLSARDGERVPAREWSRRWIVDRGLCREQVPDPGPADVVRIVVAAECQHFFRRRWKVHRSRYLPRLRAIHTAEGESPRRPPVASAATVV